MLQAEAKQSWSDYETLADNYKAIGSTDIWLSDYDGPKDRPWELVTKCEPGSSHRLDISTSITFYAKAPSGLTYRWVYDIEERDANGRGHYMIKTADLKHIMARLPEKARTSLKEYFAACAKAVKAKGDEWNELVRSQYGTAVELENLSK